MVTLKNLFILNTLVALSYGLGALFFPVQVMSSYGLTLNAAGELMTRFYGAELIAHGWMTWFVRHANVSPTRKAILGSRCIGNAIRTVVALAFMASGQADFRGWLIIALFAFFALAYAYFWLIRPDAD